MGPIWLFFRDFLHDNKTEEMLYFLPWLPQLLEQVLARMFWDMASWKLVEIPGVWLVHFEPRLETNEVKPQWSKIGLFPSPILHLTQHFPNTTHSPYSVPTTPAQNREEKQCYSSVELDSSDTVWVTFPLPPCFCLTASSGLASNLLVGNCPAWFQRLWPPMVKAESELGP